MVEDDVATLDLISELVTSAGLQPTGFTRLSSARRALRDGIPSVLVVDDDLPDGHGADLVQELRDNPQARNLAVIFCTAASERRRREISSLAPVVPKPFRVHELERALSEAAGRH